MFGEAAYERVQSMIDGVQAKGDERHDEVIDALALIAGRVATLDERNEAGNRAIASKYLRLANTRLGLILDTLIALADAVHDVTVSKEDRQLGAKLQVVKMGAKLQIA